MKLSDEVSFAQDSLELLSVFFSHQCEVLCFHARTESYENLFKSGVIDPAKVARVALQNAASIAGMLLTTECVMCDIKEPEPPMPANSGMGGMY